MTTTLNLDAPGAAEALARCYRLLRQWAAEARAKQATTQPTPSATGAGDRIQEAADSKVCDQGEPAAKAAPDEAGHGREVMSLDCAE